MRHRATEPTMFLNVLHVALGGAVGAALRYLTGIGVMRMLGHTSFPLPIITVNVIGSFAMGFFVVSAAKHGLTQFSPLIMTGLLGGFTTFSAFSLETMTLIERGQHAHAVLYVTLSVSLSVGALAAGLWTARSLWT